VPSSFGVGWPVLKADLNSAVRSDISAGVLKDSPTVRYSELKNSRAHETNEIRPPQDHHNHMLTYACEMTLCGFEYLVDCMS
jgi:hypothetical protein